MKVGFLKFLFVTCFTLQVSYFPVLAQLNILNGSSATFCEGDKLILRATSGFNNYSWFIEFDTTSLSFADTLLLDSVPNLGFYYFVIATDSNNVSYRDSIFVRQFLTPRFSLGPDIALCSGDTATIRRPALGTIPGTGLGSQLWNTGATDTFIRVTTPGIYWMRQTRVVVTLSCSFTDSVNVSITAGPQITASNDTSICSGTFALLNSSVVSGTPPYQTTWTPSGGLNNPTISNPVATPSATTTYRVIVRDASILQCNADTAFVTINVAPPINVSITPQNPAVCPDSVFNLSATATGGAAPFTYNWTPSTGLNATQGPTVTLTAINSINYIVTVTDSVGCSTTGNTNVTVNSLSVSIPQQDSILCEGSDYQLNAVVNGGLPPYSFLWNQGLDKLSSSTSANPIATPGSLTTPLVYIVRVRDQANCQKFDSVTLGTRPIPSVVVSPKIDSVRVFNSAQFTASASGGAGEPYTFEWSPVNINVVDVNTPVLTFTGNVATLGNREYYVIAIDSSGCPSLQDTITVFTFALPQDSINLQDQNVIFIPKFFRPNSTNSNNSSLRIFGTNISEDEFMMMIYNRWGQVVFENSNLQLVQELGWNGAMNNSGNELPQGAYTYTVSGKFLDGTPINLVGSATLFR